MYSGDGDKRISRNETWINLDPDCYDVVDEILDEMGTEGSIYVVIRPEDTIPQEISQRVSNGCYSPRNGSGVTCMAVNNADDLAYLMREPFLNSSGSLRVFLRCPQDCEQWKKE
jgi:hypothetical protein